MAHGQWTEIEARGMLTALAKSGLSVTAFARDRGITPQRIYWWKAKLGSNETKAASAIEVLPVRVVEASAKRGEPVTVLLRSGHIIVTVRPRSS